MTPEVETERVRGEIRLRIPEPVAHPMSEWSCAMLRRLRVSILYSEWRAMADRVTVGA